MRRVQKKLATLVDGALHRLAFRPGQQGAAEALGAAARIDGLSRLAERYAPCVDDPEFLPAASAAPIERRWRGRGAAADVFDLRWPSELRPFAADVAAQYLADEVNAVAHARAFLHRDRARPTMVLIHGYLGGVLGVEQRLWPLSWMLARGLDVVLAVLPWHGPRRRRGGRPVFPNSDPRVTVEGFRQAVFDLRTLIRFLMDRGAPGIAMMGMSLGGYTTALMATVEPAVGVVAPLVPLSSIADFARDHGRLVGTAEERAAQHRLLEGVYAPVSPFSRPSLVPVGRSLVIAGEVDRITPKSHGERLARHLGAEMAVFEGGHIVQAGRSEGFRRLGRMLGELGWLEPRS